MKKILLIACFLAAFSENCFANSRYVSLAPSTTEILFGLGLDEDIVGVSSFCDFPAKAKLKQKIGDFSKPNIEKILSLKPDYIFCTGLEQAPAVFELRRLKQKVYVADPKNIDELISTILEIGKITHREYAAELMADRMRQDIERIRLQVDKIPVQERLKVLIEIWDIPLMTAGPGSFVNELLTLAGGINIAHDTKRAYSLFSYEEVIKRNPDCIIVAFMHRNELADTNLNRVGWKQINAVKNSRVYTDIDPDLLLRPGPRIVDGLKKLHQRLYPKK